MIINIVNLNDISLYPRIESGTEVRYNVMYTDKHKYNYHFRSYVPVTYEGSKYAVCVISPIQSGMGKNPSKRICKKAISYFEQVLKQYKIERWMLNDMLLKFYKLPDDYVTPTSKPIFTVVGGGVGSKDDILYKGPIKRVNTVLSKNMSRTISKAKKELNLLK